MFRQVAFYGMMLGTLAFPACDEPPQAPTPFVPPAASAPPSGLLNPSHPLAGRYTLTLDIGSQCAALPEAEKTRTYSAAIDYASDGRYVVTLGNATFLTGPICTSGSRHFSGIGCNQFFASEAIDTINLFLENNNDEAHGGHIVEQLSSGTWMEVIGSASGRISSYPLSSVEASGTGTVWYCRTPSGYPFPCSSVASCGSTDLRLTLTRR